MKEQNTPHAAASSDLWERLEALARDHVQRFLQALLEEAVTAL